MIPSHPNPVSPAERVLIDRHIAAHGLTHVLRGVSGMDVLRETSAVDWRGGQGGQPKKLRMKLARRRQLYRKLVDEGKSGREIAKTIGVKLASVYAALSRMRLKIKPKMFEAPDA